MDGMYLFYLFVSELIFFMFLWIMVYQLWSQHYKDKKNMKRKYFWMGFKKGIKEETQENNSEDIETTI